MKNINPLSNPKKSEPIKELDHRQNDSYDDMKKMSFNLYCQKPWEERTDQLLNYALP